MRESTLAGAVVVEDLIRQEAEYSILVVEDSEIDYRLVQRALQRAGTGSLATFSPHRASTMAEALRMYPLVEPDVVLLDLQLPDAAGPECVELLTTLDEDVALVVLTGANDRELGLDVLRVGASDFLTKDEISPEILRRSLLFSIERIRNRAAERVNVRERQQRRAAGELQANLLPRTTPRVAGYDIAGAYRPANKIGGDLFDFIVIDDDTLLCHVADVSGHNLVSALIMAGLRRVIRTLAPRIADLVELLRAVNEAVFEDTSSFQFVTLFLVRLHGRERCLEYVGAGHVAYVLRESGAWDQLPAQMPPLGIQHDIPEFAPERTRLDAGDLVLLPTDGFAEALDTENRLWGRQRLQRTIALHRNEPARRLAALLMGAMIEFCRPREPSDDCSVVILKVLGD